MCEHWASRDDLKKGGVRLLSIVLFLADTGDGNEREIHGGKMSVGHGARLMIMFFAVTTGEYTKELMLCCAAEVTNIRIPIQVCHTFQTRDFLA